MRTSSEPSNTTPAADVPAVKVERVKSGAAHHLAFVVGLAAVAFVALALLKPWGQGTPVAVAPSRPLPTKVATRQPASPSPSRVPSTASPDPVLAATLGRRQCQSGEGWRIVSAEDNAGSGSRTLWDVDSLAPTADAALSAASRLWAESVSAIGYCTPGNSSAARGSLANEVSIWRVGSRGELTRVDDGQIVDAALARLGEVYRAAPARLSPDGSWTPGAYLFALELRRVRGR